MKIRMTLVKGTLISFIALMFCLGLFMMPPVKKASAENAGLSDIDGMQVHFDAQTVTAADGAKIAALTNLVQSPTLDGVGNAVQNTAVNQPVYKAQSNLNGKPALRFSASSFMQIGADSGFYLQDMTIFVAANFSSLGGHGEIVSRIQNDGAWNHNWFFNTVDKQLNFGWSYPNGTNTGYAEAKAPLTADTNYILSGRKSANQGNSFINGAKAASFTGSDPADTIAAPVLLGGRKSENGVYLDDSFIGDLGELIIFDRGLTDSELMRVEKYLEAKWGMQSIHEGQLLGINIGGKALKQFNSAIKNYSILTETPMNKDDVTVTKWNEEDTVQITQNGSNVTIEVTGAATQTKNTYTIQMETMQYDFNEIQKISSREVKLNDGFWSDLYRQYSVYTVNYMFDMFDKSLSFDNFDRVAAGEKKVLNNTSSMAGKVMFPDNDKDTINGAFTQVREEPWREGLIYEGMRAASGFIMDNKSDPAYAQTTAALYDRMNGYVQRVYNAALKTTYKDGSGKPVDGYFSTYNILTRTHVIDESDVTARFHHDVYNFGCLAEAAVYWYNASGDTRLLYAATRFAEFLIDYINGRDGFPGYKVVPAHELSEEAMQNLYEIYKNNPSLVKLMETKYSAVAGLSTEDRYYKLKIRYNDYAEIAASWITGRGNSEGRYNETNYGVYAQDHAPYDEQGEALGHAVRANLWYNGIAYIGNRQENFSFVAAAKTIYDNITGSQLYVTGGTGSTHDGEEAYGGSNQLPHDGYCETCASVGMAFFSQNMFYALGDAKYADTVELEMYNGILGCLGMDGHSFYYTNPMISENYQRPMFSSATPCCVPMFLKYFAELQSMIYAKTADTLFVNQFVSSTVQTSLNAKDATVIQHTDLPNGNFAQFTVNAGAAFTMKVRMPSWAENAAVTVNGSAIDCAAGKDGYLSVALSGGKSVVKVVFGKTVLRVYQDYAAENVGYVAIKYGPFVYCAEGMDNAPAAMADSAVLKADAAFNVRLWSTVLTLKAEGKYDKPLPVNVLQTHITLQNGSDAVFTMIPFFARGNRDSGAGAMRVWLKQA